MAGWRSWSCVMRFVWALFLLGLFGHAATVEAAGRGPNIDHLPMLRDDHPSQAPTIGQVWAATDIAQRMHG